jgi:hypothetical protein
MKSRGARLTLLILFIVSLAATAYLFWNGESLASARMTELNAFNDQARAVSKALLETRAAQQAYVAAGQAGEYWPGKVSEGINATRGAITALRGSASSPQVASELEAALDTLDDFTQLDRRARGFTSSGQQLLASDLIFGDGMSMIAAIDSRLEQARTTEHAAGLAEVGTFEKRQAFALTAGAAAAALVVLLLIPGAQSERGTIPIAAAPATSDSLRLAAPARPAASLDLPLESEEWSPPGMVSLGNETNPEQVSAAANSAQEVQAEASVPETASAPDVVASPPAPASIQIEPKVDRQADFRGLASLCTDLARVIDTHELPSLLDRASSLLDARGIILWIADPDGRELNPIVAHGYPAQLVNRLGTIARDAENATAAAFRTSLLQTVDAGTDSTGAIAAPLVTPGGCVGVMAAEVVRHAEREESRLAAAAIVAAQLATLVGPPARSQNRAEVAGA